MQKQQEIDRNLDDHSKKMNQLNGEINNRDDAIKKLEAKNQKLLKQAEELQALTASSNDSSKRQAVEVEILESRLKELEDELKSLEAERKTELEGLKNVHKLEVDKLKSEMKNRYEEMLKNELTKLRQSLQQISNSEKKKLAEAISRNIREEHQGK
mgnify:CR=1 FL=1